MYRNELSLVLSRSYGPAAMILTRWLCALDGKAQHGGFSGLAVFECDRYEALDQQALFSRAGKRRVSGIERHRGVHRATRVSRAGFDYYASSTRRTRAIAASAPRR